MTTDIAFNEDAKKQQTCPLDGIDRQLLQLLQEDFPIVEYPWKVLSGKLGISEKQVIIRVENLYATGVIRKIGPIVDLSKVGYTSATLVALRVPENQIGNAASVINQYSNISHNYERDCEYNVWFTLVAKNTQELTNTLNEILQKIGLSQNDALNLPTVQRFKINVNFNLTNDL